MKENYETLFEAEKKAREETHRTRLQVAAAILVVLFLLAMVT